MYHPPLIEPGTDFVQVVETEHFRIRPMTVHDTIIDYDAVATSPELLGAAFGDPDSVPMPYTMEDFQRQYVKEHFGRLTPEERREALKSLPPEERLAGLSAEEIRQYLDQLTAQVLGVVGQTGPDRGGRRRSVPSSARRRGCGWRSALLRARTRRKPSSVPPDGRAVRRPSPSTISTSVRARSSASMV